MKYAKTQHAHNFHSMNLLHKIQTQEINKLQWNQMALMI